MKNNFDRTKTETSRFSVRAIAMVLFFVMLLTAIGSGSVISAIAEGAKGPAVASAVKAVINGADLDEAVLQKKGDSDLAGSGASFRSTATVIFDNTATNWSAVYLVYGKEQYNANWFYSTELTNVSGTNLYVGNPSNDWSGTDGNTLAFVDGEGATLPTGSSDFWRSKIADFDHYTNYKDEDLAASTNYVYTPASGDNNATISRTTVAGYTNLNKTLTVKTALYDGASYAETDTQCGTFSASGASKLTALNTSSNSTFSQSGGTGTLSTAKTNTAAISQSSGDDYTFMGWKSGSLDTTGSSLTTGTYSHTNTGSDATVYAYYKLARYNVTINAGSNGTISTSPASLTGLTGSQTITVTANPSSGYHVVWPAGFSSTGTNTATVTVTGAATYNVTFEKDTYTLTKADVVEGGSFTLSPGTSPQAWGTEITVTPIPDTGYAVDTIKYNNTDITEAKKFDMPQANTTVTVTFKKVDYTITKGTVTGDGCDITIDKATANYQDTVTVTCTPATGYKISTVKYGSSNATKDGSNSNKWTFSMPASNTTVTAEFVKEDYAITKTVYPESSGSISVKKSSTEVNKYNIGDSLSLSATPAEHYTFKNFTVTGATTETLNTNPATLNMSGKTGEVTVTANFDKTTYKNINYVGKYSTTGAEDSYTNDFPVELVFGSATSGTNQDGVTITAPVATGYTFYRWDVTGGTVASSTSATTTFNPTQNGATVIAKYKKNYTVTATAGEHGSIAGTTPTTVAAGDTVTYTFTPDSGYGLSSVKVNDVEKLDAVYTVAHPFTTEPITADTTVAASFAPAITVNAAVSKTNAARSADEDNDERFHYGTGKVQINGGTANDSTASAVVTTGSNVTFTAIPDTGWGFGGWYAEETCEHLVSSEQTMTIPVSEDNKTYYAAFIEDHYYLVGDFYLADYAQYHKEGHDSVNFAFTPDSSNPGLFTYEDDFMFKYNSDESTYHLQYVAVSWGAESNGMYSTPNKNDPNGTPSSGIAVENDDCYKWRIGDETGAYSNCYKRVKITWDAINEKLSWEFKDVDMSQYTVMYIHGGNTYQYDYIWIKGGNPDGSDKALTATDKSIYLVGIPYVTISDTVYNELLIKNDTLGSHELGYILSNNININAQGVTKTGNKGGVYANGVYKIDPTVNDGNAVTQDNYYISGQYTNGDRGFFKSASGTTAATTDAMTAGSGGTFTWETPAGAATNAGCIPTGVIQFKVLKNPDANDYTEASYPEYAQSYRIKSNITKLTFTYHCSDHSITVTPTYKEQAWVSGDYYTSEGKVNSDRKVADSPNIGSTSSYSFCWAKNDDGPGRDNGNCAPINTVKNDNNGYWADLTTIAKSNNQIYFALNSSQGSGATNGNIVGNNSEQINCSASNKTIYNSSGQKAFDAELKDKSSVKNNVKFILINNMDWSKMSAIGVMAYYSGSGNLVDYQFYFRPTAPAEPDPIPEPGTVKTVDIYAKDATLRDNTFNRFALLADTSIDLSTFEFTDPGTGTVYKSVDAYNSGYAAVNNLALMTAVDTTKHAAYGSGTSTDRGAGYEVVQNVPVGAKIKIKTQLADSRISAIDFGKAFDQTHYLKAYSYNGMTYQVHTASDMTNGLVEETWTVRDVNTFREVESSPDLVLMKDKKTIEITPIYYLQDNTNTRTFYIEGYDGTVHKAWGNMLSVYPYYEGKSNKENAFGGYPGQPMLLWGGKYQMEVPLTVDGSASGATVKGLTLHNGYWDLLHRELDLIAGQQHAQTYDFDDFYKLNKEKNPDSIIFDFKYFSKAAGTDNFGDGYNYTKYNFASGYDVASMSRNEEENLTDYYNRQVDAFGTVLTDDDKVKPHLTFVSTGYKDTYVGEYATIWAVYKPDNTFLGYISSSMLYLNNIDRVKQYTDGTNTAQGRMSWSVFTDTYNTLKSNYTRTPVKISYEKELWNDSKDKANRSDGRWYYSKNSDKVSANIKIQYGPAALIDKADKSLSSDAWTYDTFDAGKTGVGGEHNIGSVTGCSAYFTNTTPVNLNGKTESGSVFSDTTKYFNFKAQASGSYIFAGWVRLNNGKYYEISDTEIGQSNMSANDTYIARFVEAKAGTLIVSHDVEQTDVFKGTGTPSITVLIRNGETEVDTLTNSKGENIDLTKYIKTANRHYTIDISLSTDPDDVSESYMKEIVSSAGNFAATPAAFNTGSGTPSTEEVNATVKQFTVNDILDTGVTNLRYVSHLMKPEYHYSYDITYTYNSRFYGEQSYTVSGTFGAVGKPAADGNMTGAKTTAKLTNDFIINQTPYEKNFREKINWNYTNEAVGKADAMVSNTAELDLTQSNTYKMTAHVYSANTVDDSVKAEFLLPYPHQDQENGYKIAPVKSYYKDGSGNDAVYNENDYIFDESQESVTVETKAYSLFTYDDKEDADDLNLIEAAPYVWKDPEARYSWKSDSRYYTGDNFTIDGTTYYYNAVPAGKTGTALTAADTVTWDDKEVKYAISTGEGNQQVVYTFEEYIKDGVFTNGYNVYSKKQELDGFYLDQDGTATDAAPTAAKKYFTRWDIFNSDGDLVANGYDRFFNFTGYENYLIKAVYESPEPAQTGTSPVETMATITYLGDTRNQWNNGHSGSNAREASDELYADFAIAYRYNGEQIDQIDSANHEIKTGMIIERLGAVEEIGGTKMTDISYYIDMYKSDASTVTAIQDAFNNAANNDPANSALKDALDGNTAMNSKIGANVDGWGSKFGETAGDATTKMKFNSIIDNFNRLQWCYNFKNNKDNQDVKTSVKNAKYVFRAWSYIIVDGVATVSSTPAYFTFYDTAVR